MTAASEGASVVTPGYIPVSHVLDNFFMKSYLGILT